MGRFSRKMARNNVAKNQSTADFATRHFMSKDECERCWEFVDESTITHNVAISKIRSIIKRIYTNEYRIKKFNADMFKGDHEIPFQDVLFVAGSKHITCRVTVLSDPKELNDFIENDVAEQFDNTFDHNKFTLCVIVAFITLKIGCDDSTSIEIILPIKMVLKDGYVYPAEKVGVRLSNSHEYTTKVSKTTVLTAMLIMTDTMMIWYLLMTLAQKNCNFVNKINDISKIDTTTGARSFMLTEELIDDAYHNSIVLNDDSAKSNKNNKSNKSDSSGNNLIEISEITNQPVNCEQTINIAVENNSINNSINVVELNNLNDKSTNTVQEVQEKREQKEILPEEVLQKVSQEVDDEYNSSKTTVIQKPKTTRSKKSKSASNKNSVNNHTKLTKTSENISEKIIDYDLSTYRNDFQDILNLYD